MGQAGALQARLAQIHAAQVSAAEIGIAEVDAGGIQQTQVEAAKSPPARSIQPSAGFCRLKPSMSSAWSSW